MNHEKSPPGLIWSKEGNFSELYRESFRSGVLILVFWKLLCIIFCWIKTFSLSTSLSIIIYLLSKLGILLVNISICIPGTPFIAIVYDFYIFEYVLFGFFDDSLDGIPFGFRFLSCFQFFPESLTTCFFCCFVCCFLS